MKEEQGQNLISPQTDVNTPIVLDAHLSIRNINDLYEKLIRLFEKRTVLDIDASQITSIDTAALQLLTVLKREAIVTGKTVTFDFPSEAFVSSASLLGLEKILEIDRPQSGLF